MKYYALKYSSDTKEIGRKFPQSIKFMTRMGSIQEDTIGDFGPIDNKSFIVPDLEVSKTAKVTSLISSAGIVGSKFLVIDKDLLGTFQEFNLGSYQVWPIDVWWKGNKLEDYFLFHLSYPSNDEWIDFSKTEFEMKEIGSNEFLGVKVFKDFHDFKHTLLSNFEGKRAIPYTKEIYLKPTNTKSDMVRLSLWFSGLMGYFISERLKEELEYRNHSGMNFVPLEQSNNRIRLI